jgi:hypothetical protein
MSTLSKQILRQASGLPEGAPLSAKDLLHLGNRAAVDQALSRLVRRQLLLRVSRGIYALPIHTRFGTHAPSPEKITERLSMKCGETFASHGAIAANRLGLTTQVPTRSIYYTSGRNRQLKLGAQTVELIHAHSWQLLFPNQYAGDVIRALSWLGPELAHILIEKTPSTVLSQVASTRAQLPGWMAQVVSKYMLHE